MLSFIVPAYNEEVELPATLSAIREAARNLEHEIIVVDDASTDGTLQIAHAAHANVISINRRQIAAARNAGGNAAHGNILFFVDADTHITLKHVSGAIAALEAGYSGGGARAVMGGRIPTWSRIFFHVFCTIYFGLNLGAGAFLFTTRKNFNAIGGFDEKFFIGEEIYFSIALRTLGQFKILPEPIVTSGSKLRIYSAREILGNSLSVICRGPRAAHSRDGLHIWYDGRRETRSAFASGQPGSHQRCDQST